MPEGQLTQISWQMVRGGMPVGCRFSYGIPHTTSLRVEVDEHFTQGDPRENARRLRELAERLGIPYPSNP